MGPEIVTHALQMFSGNFLLLFKVYEGERTRYRLPFGHPATRETEGLYVLSSLIFNYTDNKIAQRARPEDLQVALFTVHVEPYH